MHVASQQRQSPKSPCDKESLILRRYKWAMFVFLTDNSYITPSTGCNYSGSGGGGSGVTPLFSSLFGQC